VVRQHLQLKVADKTVDAARALDKLDDLADTAKGLEKIEDVGDGLKGMDELEDVFHYVDDIPSKQNKLIDNVESGKLELEGYDGHKPGNHTRKANYGEMKMDQHMKDQGFEPLHKQIDDIDQPIKQGIDGVYMDPGPPPKYAIVESKYGSSKLSQAPKDGPQMSDDWIEGGNRLDNAVGKEMAETIRDSQLLDPNSVEKVLVNVDDAGNVTTNTIDAAGKVADPWP